MKKNSMWKMAMSLMIVLAAICFSGCADKEDEDDKKEQTYYMENTTISRTDFENVTSRYKNLSNYSATYSQIKELRASLRKYYPISSESKSGIKKSELYKFLTESGRSSSEVNELIEIINDRGNAIWTFYSELSEDYYVWVYIEKE